MTLLSRTLISLVSLTGLLTVPSSADDLAFSVKDSIEMVRFNAPRPFAKALEAEYSPDGRYLVVVTSRGILATNQVESTIWLWNAKKVSHLLNGQAEPASAKPIVLARISAVPSIYVSRPYEAVVSDLRWSPDGRRLLFLGENSHAERLLYEADLRSGRIQKLTPDGYSVQQFDFNSNVLVYTAIETAADNRVDWSRAMGDEINAEARAVTGVGLESILFKQEPGYGNGRSLPQLWYIRRGRLHRVPQSSPGSPEADIPHSSDVLSLSPDGKSAIRLVPVAGVRKEWERYEAKPGFRIGHVNSSDPQLTSPNNLFRLREYRLTNLETGESKILVSAPFADTLGNSDAAKAVWSRDGKRILLTNLFLPLGGEASGDGAAALRSCAVAAVEATSLAAQCIVRTRDASTVVTADNPAPLRLVDVSFGRTDDEIEASFNWHGTRTASEGYRFRDGQWKLVKALDAELLRKPLRQNLRAEESGSNISLTIHQSLNSAPTLWAKDTSGKSAEIWDPNPQFARKRFSEAAVYRWIDATGYEWSGILVKPRNYTPGKRYPLVIQTHGFSDFGFITDGIYPTAMAARPLATVGFFVLQTTYRYDAVTGTPQETAVHVEEFASAIDSLASQGLVDPDRVGIIGFSRTCFHVESALTSRPALFAAATVADGADAGYSQYLLLSEGRDYLKQEFEKIHQATPFGDRMQRWMDGDSSFHLDKVITPLRIEAIGQGGVLMEWGLYSSLEMQNKPVDLIYIPDGQHILQKPLERYASQQGNVDWFRFWLQGYIDPASNKARQYERWDLMRDRVTGLERNSGTPAQLRHSEHAVVPEF